MITQNYLILAPAYGRDYKDKASVMKDFLEGKDFAMMSIIAGGGRYCSVENFAPGTKVTLRYKRLCAVCVVTIPNAPKKSALQELKATPQRENEGEKPSLREGSV